MKIVFRHGSIVYSQPVNKYGIECVHGHRNHSVDLSVSRYNGLSVGKRRGGKQGEPRQPWVAHRKLCSAHQHTWKHVRGHEQRVIAGWFIN